MDNKALGKGLSALIQKGSEDFEDSVEQEAVSTVPVKKIRHNSLQPRKDYDDAKLDELKASIQEKGFLQPIIVREIDGGYEVIAGERRLRAAEDLNLKDIPVVIKNVSDEEVLVLALIENIQREQLNPIEEAEAYKKLIEDFSLNHEAVARSVGKDRSTVTNLMRLLKLPAHIKRSVFENRLSVGHGRALLSVENMIQRDHLFNMCVNQNLSVRELEELIKKSTQGTVRQKKNQPAKQPEVLVLEEKLQEKLGTKVAIDAKRKKGKIIIEYYSLEDLERVIKLIAK
ncbi:MAG: ParB/RepB/Spo0J family partition protein [Candidatus Omnitrophica bacterium]|nr:ParB/RepB/Spo0J family partition protein [Candidatus Omnitrophota bacterium]